MLSILHPEIEFSSALVEGKTYRGLEGMVQYRKDLDSAWSDWHTEGDRFIPIWRQRRPPVPDRRHWEGERRSA